MTKISLLYRDTFYQFLKTRRVLVGAILAFLIGSLFIYLFRDLTLPAASALLALLTIWAGILPGILFFARDSNNRSLLPLASLVGLFFAIFFGFSVFFNHILAFHGSMFIDKSIYIYAQSSERSVSIPAQFLVLFSLLLFYAAYFTSQKIIWYRLPKYTFPVVPRENLITYVLILFLIFFVAYYYLPVIQSIPSLGQIIQPIGYMCFGGLYFLWKKRKLSIGLTGFVFFIAFPLIWIKLIADVTLTPIVLFIIFYLLIRLWIFKKISLVPLVVIPVLIILIYPVIPIIRGALWVHFDRDFIGEMAVEMTKDKHPHKLLVLNEENTPVANEQKPVLGLSKVTKTRYRGLIQRIAHMSVFTYVVDHSPSSIPLLEGESYRPLLTNLVPRALWPEKPEERFGNYFGRRYGFIPETDKGNAINIPWITEMYVNFGVHGVIGGMLVLGIALSGLVSFLAHWSASPIEQIAGAAILFPLFFQESNLSMMVGSLPWQIIGIWMCFYIAYKVPFERFKKIWETKKL